MSQCERDRGTHSEKAMNICFISQEFPPDTGWGGIGTYVYNISRGLAEIGHHVDVITRAISTDGTVESHNGRLRIHRVWHKDYPWLRKQPLSSLKLYPFFYHVLDRPLGWGYGAYKHLQRLCKEKQIDIIEVAEHNADGFIYTVAKFMFGKHINAPKFVIKLHIPMLYYYRLNQYRVTLDIKILDTLERWTTYYADGITSPSRQMATIVSEMWRLHQKKITVLPHPVDESLFIPDIPIRRDDECILFVGRLEKQKGVDLLIEAFQTVRRKRPQAKLLLVGGDRLFKKNGEICSYKAYLQQKLRDASLEVGASIQFVGQVEREHLPAYYQKGSVCIVPSEFESFSYVCVEAMACGRPIIANNSGGTAEIIEHGKNGLLIPSGNPNILAENIIYLLEHPDLAENMGQEARKRVEHNYSKHAIAQRTAQFYQSLCES
jgi:glycogen(starch) synthase